MCISQGYLHFPSRLTPHKSTTTTADSSLPLLTFSSSSSSSSSHFIPPFSRSCLDMTRASFSRWHDTGVETGSSSLWFWCLQTRKVRIMVNISLLDILVICSLLDLASKSPELGISSTVVLLFGSRVNGNKVIQVLLVYCVSIRPVFF